MEFNNEIVQIYIPVTDIKRSVQWYVDVFGFHVIWEESDSANLKLKQGPLVFLKKTDKVQPIKYYIQYQENPIISFKTNNLDKLQELLKSKEYDVDEINEYGIGKNGPYREFYIRDPDQNLIEINSYPDIHLQEFRGY